MKPIRYDDWAKQWSPGAEYGLKLLVADKVLQVGQKIYDTLGRQLGTTIARFLAKGGYRTSGTIDISVERDASIRAFEHCFVGESTKGETIPEYLVMLYENWSEERCRVEIWRAASIWSYIGYALKRNFSRIFNIEPKDE